MDNEMIIGILEGQGLDEQQIADIMAEISEIDNGALDPTRPASVLDIVQMENQIKNQMDGEEDWREKARLAARIISMNLE